jgi:MFS superfamily sulfate permease-like transporter
VIPQAIITVTNAIFATSLLATDLFSTEIKPKKLSRTIGLMNLTSVPFGGMPMCHGAGGIAGQFRYGARTDGANVYAGLSLIACAFLFTSPA